MLILNDILLTCNFDLKITLKKVRGHTYTEKINGDLLLHIRIKHILQVEVKEIKKIKTGNFCSLQNQKRDSRPLQFAQRLE